ncbi:glycosyl hydrolase family 79 C-terminal domain-containing protein [Mucilaginibacter sp. X4EP1]|uniref:glycosyl hydrolase family 79 C-terminal domain-containing protein n=1 Tax=Mucilaginibacter sp. X4EP1 TaxID=2723092 RepID=UPI002168C009|nr:glycosyl hydrolase family 79 C-terminal domain-containing protein [Mucilaginibacter sp. X4EP1]MCS3815511.1 hypothetical protein [Mucilaginibacter sp. X4EP1]
MKKICILALCLLILSACVKKSDLLPDPQPAPPLDLKTDGILTLDIDHPANAIPQNFEGLSFENWILSRNPEYLDASNAVMVQLIKNLGPGVIRMGGNSSDETDWIGDGFNADTHFDVLTTLGIDRLAAFSRKTNWQVIFGLNLGHNNINASIDEAKYLYQQLGANLYTLQIGNEPDYFDLGYRPAGYSVYDFQSEWMANFAPIKTQIPEAQFAGPDVSDHLEWAQTFAANNSRNIVLLDAHYYNDGPASSPYINCQTILSGDDTLIPYLQTLDKSSKQAGLPYRITETNSIWGGGKPGVSDAFAGTLWALDLMWAVAANNGQGINFHGGELVYSPITVASNGQCTTNAVYYAMLAFKYGASGGTIIPVNIVNNNSNYNVYACSTNGGYTITIINKEQTKDISLIVNAGKTVTSINVMSLTAPAVDSTTGITFAGATVQSDGSFSPAHQDESKIGKSSFGIKVPAASAVVIVIK